MEEQTYETNTIYEKVYVLSLIHIYTPARVYKCALCSKGIIPRSRYRLVFSKTPVLVRSSRQAVKRLSRQMCIRDRWSPSGFPFGVRRGMIGCGTMPLDTFTYYLLKVGFIPPLRAHLALSLIHIYYSF